MAAVVCYAAKDGAQQYEYDELEPFLKKTGYVFDPWLRGKPDVYTLQTWLDSVTLMKVQLHWNSSWVWSEGSVRVETHAKPVYH